MPDRCSVTKCRSNYDSVEGYITVFRFPNDVEQRNLWLRKIPRKDWIPGPSARVCELHFDQKFVSKELEYIDAKGNKKMFPRTHPILLPGAVPTIFQNVPKYLSSTPNRERSDPEKRRKIVEEREETAREQAAEAILLSQLILDFNDLVNSYAEHVDANIPWKFEISDDSFAVFKIDFVDYPKITVCAKIDVTLRTTVYQNGYEVPSTDLNSAIRTKNCTLTHWSHFENLLRYCDSNSYGSESLPLVLEGKITSCFKELISHFEDDEKKSNKLRFLCEQFQLACCDKNSLRYTPYMMVNSFMIHMLSPASYDGLRANSLLTLPHPNRLIQITQKIVFQSTVTITSTS